MSKWKIMAGYNCWELSGHKKVASSFQFSLEMDLFQTLINELPLKMRRYYCIFQVKSEGSIDVKKTQKIVPKELTHLGWSNENEMKHDRAQCKVGHTGTNENFCYDLCA